MIERIERCAARVIALLRDRRTVNVLLLPELLGERSMLAYQALGWLARESKVRYTADARQIYVSLVDEAMRNEGQ